MSDAHEAAHLDDIAAEAFALLGTGRQIAPFSSRYRDFGLEDAYRVTAKVRALREKAGEIPRGRKIGFTNRTIWAEYGVYAPIWGFVYDSTVHDLENIDATFSLAALAEPRIEPEIVFGLSAAPQRGMDVRDLLSCIGWVAPGFEIVQSVFPDWRFAAADTVAAFGLHGALLIGPRHPIRGAEDPWVASLATFEIDLNCDGNLADHGAARNVLDGPLFALRHLVEVLAEDGNNPPLAAGEIVTTGTLTRALPIRPGEIWSTHLTGVALEGASVRFS
jgi:2-oxo-3-hexenedioate decarboxylase